MAFNYLCAKGPAYHWVDEAMCEAKAYVFWALITQSVLDVLNVAKPKQSSNHSNPNDGKISK
jgi:hypothetical protein